MVESMILTSYPASIRGVAIAKIPNGAVASMLENDGTKKNDLLRRLHAVTSRPFGLVMAILSSDSSWHLKQEPVKIRTVNKNLPAPERCVCRHRVNFL